jgi:cell division protein FtsN
MVYTSLTKPREEARVKRIVTVHPGDSIYTIAEKNYKVANTSIVDQILEFNPKIANPNKLFANQEVKLPEITETSLVIESADGSYQVRLGTFLKAEYATFLKGQPALKGRGVEVVPRKLSSGGTWYRAVAGKFNTREEGLRVIQELKKQGLSPFFPGFRKS